MKDYQKVENKKRLFTGEEAINEDLRKNRIAAYY